jgi:glycogen debranching enzyme
MACNEKGTQAGTAATKKAVKYTQLFSALLFFAVSAKGQEIFRHQAITLAPGDSTTFFFTNKTTGFYYGEARRLSASPHQGFNLSGQKYFEDYFLAFDGVPLDRRAAEVWIYPDRLKRKYSLPPITEELFLLDSLNVLAIKVASSVPGMLDFIPAFSGSNRASDFEQIWQEEHGVLLLGQRNLINRQSEFSLPAWTAVFGHPTGSFIPFTAEEQKSHSRQFVISAYLPGRLRVNLRDSVFFYVAVGQDHASLISLKNFLFKNFHARQRQRIGRLQDLHARSGIHSNLTELNNAVAWVNYSLDALIMHPQDRRRSREEQERSGIPKAGIYAGLPWFNNFWGRDTFISLPGATLVAGDFADAREILLAFARFQLRDSTDRRDGRIPNRIQPGEIIYNTADGTGWFVRAARDYVNYSGDTSFVHEIFPVVAYAINATLRTAVDSLGLLMHADAETWMDAVGPQGPWSPRGNRAVDIQALWFEQLQAGVQLAEWSGRRQYVQHWKSAAEKLRHNFYKFFYEAPESHLHDHLNSDGTPDRQLRPNQIFALTVPSQPLVPPRMAAQILQTVVNKLTYPYGVASLSQDDDNFHPYHHHEPVYVQDAAYHNGTVWTWLSGPVITALVRSGHENLAFKLLQDAVQQILHRGTLGAQSELLDAIAHPGEPYPRLSGTFAQAWNLAEFLRNVYHDFLGVQPDAITQSFTLAPTLPDSLREAAFQFVVGSAQIRAHYWRRDNLLNIELEQSSGDRQLRFEVINRRAQLAWLGTMPRNRSVRLVLSPSGKNDKISGATAQRQRWQDWWQQVGAEMAGETMAFATPHLRADLPALKGPDYPLLAEAETLRPWPAKILLTAQDSLNDDRGPNGRYTYPLEPAFEAGIFDLEKFAMAADEDYFYFRLRFRHLTQPGWHPEYGFQLTYCAIALDADGDSDTGGKQLGMNANFSTAPEIGFDRVIYVGGGFRVVDEKEKILAEFLPTNQSTGEQRLGNIETREIAFAVPARFIGKLGPKWKVGIYCGAQDDHGGAGVGEFRNVERKPGPWVGGGGEREAGNPNVYDLLIADYPN